LLSLLLLAAIFLGVGVGSVAIPPGRSLEILGGAIGIGTLPAGPDTTILLLVRLPRVIGAGLIGAALATAGTALQGLLRNPLADPYAVGASAGAALGATIALALGFTATFLGFGAVAAFGFLGALGAVVLVYQLAQVGGFVSNTSLLLAGFATSAVLGAGVTLLMVLSDPLALRLRDLILWLMGGVSVVGWSQLPLVFAVEALALLLLLPHAGSLDALALGEEGAAAVGVDVVTERRIILALASLLTALAVSIGGLIGFVGLLVPHGLRLILGPAHARLLPASALGGASFLILADLLARTVVSPGEVPVGVFTALVGGPFFLLLLQRGRRMED
ncbi:MAG TPA: iron ABC transporter permease, partial [Chloroflexota bacterium]|nr:iron ABC transporter permease [Chloroflexota bacterium]